MPGFDWLNQFLSRLQGYPVWQVLLELLIIGAIVYMVVRFVQGTRAAGALRTVLLVLVACTVLVRLASQRDMFPRLDQLYTRFLGFLAIALVVIFQPELRRALIRMGELPAVGPIFRGMTSTSETTPVVDAVVGACKFLSKNKFGAIIAVERQVGLREVLEGSKPLNADVSPELLQSIFWPNNPLHDMAVVIRGRKIIAASVQFPLADPDEVADSRLGTRHRAAVGLTRATDALVVVVSEETGAISLAERGALMRWLTPESLRDELLKRLRPDIAHVSAGSGDEADIRDLSGEPVDTSILEDKDRSSTEKSA
ncbi:MAG: TIGR00159 family protein [Phycisphaerales bacterium]|nr:MAG: TIGR00159 family protein [Phycisphaerales bacterium]